MMSGCAALLGFLGGTFFAVAAPIPAEPEAPPATAVETWRKILEQKCDLTFQNTSLREAVDVLKERTKLPIYLDPMVMNFGVNIHEPNITLELKQIKVEDALRRILAPYNLHLALTREGVIISSEELTIARQLRQRVRVNCDGRPFVEVIRQLSAETGANLIVDPRLKDKAEHKITLRLEDVPLESAVRLLAEVADLRTLRMNNVLFITTAERAERLRADADGPVPSGPPSPSVIPAGPIAGPGIGFGVFGGAAPLPAPAFPGIPGAEPAVPPGGGEDRPVPEKKKEKDPTPLRRTEGK